MRYGSLKQTDKGFDYDPQCGSSIDACVKECVHHAKLKNEVITLRNFNGIDITVTPDTDAETALHVWRSEIDRRAEAYRNSPEGKRAAKEAEDRKNHCQRTVDRLLTFVPQQLDELIPWLSEFSEVADHVGLNWDMGSLIAKLESYGYVANAHVTKDKKAVKNWTKRQHGEYIVGQALACMKHGMPPHPITQKFAEEYVEMSA